MDWPAGLARELVEVYERRGVARPYAHQARAIELALAGHDVLISTPTASGKTLAYAAPVLNALLAERNPEVTPDRWLVTHGEDDEVLSFERTLRHMGELADGGFPLRFEVFDKPHIIDLRYELPMIRSFLTERLGL